MLHYRTNGWTSELQMRTSGDAYYTYDSSGQRARKVINRIGGTRTERFYMGGFEIYREFGVGNTLDLERETLHVLDGDRKVATIDTKTVDTSTPSPPTNNSAPYTLIRYQYDNHLGSASLELDDSANIISYEEYYPFGTTSYSEVDANREVPKRRYRYTGKERDEESGLYYHGARYYIPWLCRWSQCDPIGIKDGLNIYAYCSNNPVMLQDLSGMEGEKFKDPSGKEQTLQKGMSASKDGKTIFNNPEAKEKNWDYGEWNENKNGEGDGGYDLKSYKSDKGISGSEQGNIASNSESGTKSTEIILPTQEAKIDIQPDSTSEVKTKKTEVLRSKKNEAGNKPQVINQKKDVVQNVANNKANQTTLIATQSKSVQNSIKESNIPYKKMTNALYGNYVGPGPDKDPVFMRFTEGIEPKNKIDLAAYYHDIDYFKNRTGGVFGAFLNLNVLNADAKLTKSAFRVFISTSDPKERVVSYYIFALFGPIVVYKSFVKGVRQSTQQKIFFK